MASQMRASHAPMPRRCDRGRRHRDPGFGASAGWSERELGVRDGARRLREHVAASDRGSSKGCR